ncbi:hypothetical protein PIB30_109909, partial [Stylosanthes scabra]|nr:hypothetical protein [Stylosanthes scabra]
VRGPQKRDFGPPYLILSFSSTSNTQILPNFITLTSTKPLISLNPSIPTTKFLYIRNPCKISFDSNRLKSPNNASSKRPTKKSRGASSSMEPPPQDHPLAQWFYNKEDFDLYHSDLA